MVAGLEGGAAAKVDTSKRSSSARSATPRWLGIGSSGGRKRTSAAPTSTHPSLPVDRRMALDGGRWPQSSERVKPPGTSLAAAGAVGPRLVRHRSRRFAASPSRAPRWRGSSREYSAPARGLGIWRRRPGPSTRRAVVALDPGGDLADWQTLEWLDKGTGTPVLRSQLIPPTGPAALLETLDDRAARWSEKPKTTPIDSVTIGPTTPIQFVGRVSGVIDASMDGHFDLLSQRPFYGDPDRLTAVQAEAKAMGKRRFARRTGLSLTAAGRAAAGEAISATNVRRAWRALRTLDRTSRRCADERCDQPVSRTGALYCSASCRDRAKKRRRRAPG